LGGSLCQTSNVWSRKLLTGRSCDRREKGAGETRTEKREVKKKERLESARSRLVDYSTGAE